MEFEARKPVKYKKPSTGSGFILWGFAIVGFGTVLFLGARKMKDTVEGAGKPSPPSPVAPVTYKPLAMDDAVLILFKVTPRDARLLLDGEPLSSNPTRVPRGLTPHKISGYAEGYVPAAADFTADQPRKIELTLRKQK